MICRKEVLALDCVVQLHDSLSQDMSWKQEEKGSMKPERESCSTLTLIKILLQLLSKVTAYKYPETKTNHPDKEL